MQFLYWESLTFMAMNVDVFSKFPISGWGDCVCRLDATERSGHRKNTK